MDYLYELSLFFFKAVIAAGAGILVIAAAAMALRAGSLEGRSRRRLKAVSLGGRSKDRALEFWQKTLDKKEFKRRLKQRKKEKAAGQREKKPSSFVLSFSGDVMASQVEALREEVSLVLDLAGPKDDVILLLESRGGSVAHYGLGASQLERLRSHKIPLTVCVDRFAASGGYLMACAGDQIVAAPFAFLGSVGVLFGLPNVHEFLKKRDISYEEITAGKHKRTLTPFGKITEEKREKLKEQLELIHGQFKRFVKKRRAGIDLERAATGEAWLAEEALKLGLADRLQCSDDLIRERLKTNNVYKISLKAPPPVWEKIIKKAGSRFAGQAFRRLPFGAGGGDPQMDLDSSGLSGFSSLPFGFSSGLEAGASPDLFKESPRRGKPKAGGHSGA